VVFAEIIFGGSPAPLRHTLHKHAGLSGIQHAVKVVMFLTNPEVPGSKLSQNTSYPVEVFCGFPHSLYATARIGIKITPKQFIIRVRATENTL